jgi:hypothetical protein
MVFSPLQLQSSHTLRSFEGLYTATMLVTLWIIGALILSNLKVVKCFAVVLGKQYTGSRKHWQIGLVLAAWICSTMHASLNWLYYSKAIDDNELPGGPGLLYSLTHLDAWLEGTGDTFFCLNIFMADCLFVSLCCST